MGFEGLTGTNGYIETGQRDLNDSNNGYLFMVCWKLTIKCLKMLTY